MVLSNINIKPFTLRSPEVCAQNRARTMAFIKYYWAHIVHHHGPGQVLKHWNIIFAEQEMCIESMTQKQAFNTVTSPSNFDSQSKIKKYFAFQLKQYEEL